MKYQSKKARRLRKTSRLDDKRHQKCLPLYGLYVNPNRWGQPPLTNHELTMRQLEKGLGARWLGIHHFGANELLNSARLIRYK